MAVALFVRVSFRTNWAVEQIVRDVELAFKNQERWDQEYGKLGLASIRNSPETFVVDLVNLSKEKQDLIDTMRDVNEKLILELGCGRGEMAVTLARLGAKVTGIDIGESLVELARQVAAVNNVRCEFNTGSVDKLDFRDNSFDFVIGASILHHLPIKGVIESLSESYRVLRPGGLALFVEPIENSKIFDFLQNLFPVGTPNTDQYRPSILQRGKWTAYLQKVDDRSLSDKELIQAKDRFSRVEFRHYGLFIRLERLVTNVKFLNFLREVDSLLTHRYSPLKRLSQTVLVVYRK